MAERSARPAVLSRGWRSRPGVVRVAAVLLGLFGLLLVLVEADQGDLDAAELVTALMLVSAAAALVWAGRLGYWVGLTVAGLVAAGAAGGAGGPPPPPGHQASTVLGGPRAATGVDPTHCRLGTGRVPGRRRGAVERWGVGDGGDRSGR